MFVRTNVSMPVWWQDEGMALVRPLNKSAGITLQETRRYPNYVAKFNHGEHKSRMLDMCGSRNSLLNLLTFLTSLLSKFLTEPLELEIIFGYCYVDVALESESYVEFQIPRSISTDLENSRFGQILRMKFFFHLMHIKLISWLIFFFICCCKIVFREIDGIAGGKAPFVLNSAH